MFGDREQEQVEQPLRGTDQCVLSGMQPRPCHQLHDKIREKGETYEKDGVFEGARDQLVKIDGLVEPHAKLRLRNLGQVARVGEDLSEAAREIGHAPVRDEAPAVDSPFGGEKTAEETGVWPLGL